MYKVPPDVEVVKVVLKQRQYLAMRVCNRELSVQFSFRNRRKTHLWRAYIDRTINQVVANRNVGTMLEYAAWDAHDGSRRVTEKRNVMQALRGHLVKHEH